MQITNYNERSWAIDLISGICSFLIDKDIIIKHAGGENGLKVNNKTLFPDVLLFGDSNSGKILQGWELKMPDTDIDDAEFIDNAKKKAIAIGVNSFLLWNVSIAKLYKIESDESLIVLKTWDDLSFIQRREDVLPNKDKWINLLTNILEDLNVFFESGEIKISTIIDSLSSNNILRLILDNKGLLVENYKNIIKQNSDFEDDVTLWWNEIQREYPKDTAPLSVLATLNIFSWTNKILFANLIKNSFVPANKVEKIQNTIQPNEALILFENISSECDFWNIFKKKLGEEYIPQIVWNDIIEFNNFLIDANIKDIEQSLWHKILENLVSEDLRKIYGQYSTPKPLADLLVALTIKNKELSVWDPCCGTGTIARSAYELKEKYGIAQSNRNKTIWASDKIAFPLQLANISILKPEAMGDVLQIFQKDISLVTSGMDINFSDPYTGEDIIRQIPQIDYIVSNLPFVQQEEINTTNPDIKNINSFIQELTEENYSLDSKSDLSYYIVFYLWKILKEEGRLGLIISNSWLGTKAGEVFKNILLKFFHLESVITSGEGRWFENAKVVTNILILNKKHQSEINSDDSTNKTNFTVINKDINELDLNETLPQIRNFNASTNEFVLKSTYTKQQIKELEELGIKWTALFADLSWIIEIKDSLIKINNLFNVNRGERKGWNPLFYPKHNHNIEEVFINPSLKSSRSIKRLEASPDSVAFCCSFDIEILKDNYNNAYRWVKQFERQYNTKGDKLLPEALKANKPFWYSMDFSKTGEIIISNNPGDRIFFAKTNQKVLLDQRLIGFNRKNEESSLDLCHALMNSLIGIFFIESLGFGRGEGALDLNSEKLRDNLYILNPSLINENAQQEILVKFEALKQRDIKVLSDELSASDRQEFDEAVLSAYGLLDYKEQIQNALLCLYKIRKSVKV